MRGMKIEKPVMTWNCLWTTCNPKTAGLWPERTMSFKRCKLPWLYWYCIWLGCVCVSCLFALLHTWFYLHIYIYIHNCVSQPFNLIWLLFVSSNLLRLKRQLFAVCCIRCSVSPKMLLHCGEFVYYTSWYWWRRQLSSVSLSSVL